MHAKGDFPLNDRGPPWPWLLHGCDSKTATVLLADGVLRSSRASERVDALWAKRTAKMILDVSFTPKQGRGQLHLLICVRKATPP